MRPSLATDWLSFWLKISFVVNYRGAFRSIFAIAIDLLTSEDWYSLWMTAVPLPRWCLQSWRHSGHQICDPSRIIATWFFYCSVNPLLTQNCMYLQSDLSCLYKLNCNIFNHHERLYFSPHRPAPAISSSSPFLLRLVDSWAVTAGSGTSLVIAQWLEHSTCSRKYVA